MNESFWGAFAQLAPLASVEALSYTPVTGAVVLLLGDDGRRAAVVYLVGWLTALSLTSTVFVVGGGALVPRVHPEGPVVATLELVVGLALLVVAVLTWRARAVSGRTLERLLDRLDDASGPAVFAAGLLLGLGPKSLLLGLSAGIVVRGAALPLAEVVLAGWTVALPVVATLVAPQLMHRLLGRVERWLTRHGSLVTALVLAVVGVVVAIDAVGRW